MRLNWLIASAFFACQSSWLSDAAHAQDKGQDKEGLATFHIGNSLTNTTGKFADLARTASIESRLRRLHGQREWHRDSAASQIRSHSFDPRSGTRGNVTQPVVRRQTQRSVGRGRVVSLRGHLIGRPRRGDDLIVAPRRDDLAGWLRRGGWVETHGDLRRSLCDQGHEPTVV